MTFKSNQRDISACLKDFPILTEHNRGKPLVYLDTAASAQKPKAVIDAMSTFYERDYANIHRAVYELSERATKLYEDSRETVRQFINANQKEEIIFVRGATEAINLASQSFGKNTFQAGDEVILSEMEHHSNIVPWYLLKQQIGIVLKTIPVKDDGSLDMNAYRNLFSERTKFVAITHASNVTGVINPVADITAIAHQHHAKVLIDGAQAVSHLPVDVKSIDCDFYVFSAHKLYGPTGTGVLYGKKSLLDTMPPYQGGGHMIETVAFDNVTFAPVPLQFEAGTPDIAGVIGMRAAIDYINSVGMKAIHQHEQDLLTAAEEQLLAIPGLTIIGTAKPKVGVISFVIEDIHPHDIATVLDHEGIAVRAGHHCAMPLMTRFNVPATVRVSFGMYNHQRDIDQLIDALLLAKRLFA